jgi:hypothetical protein
MKPRFRREDPERVDPIRAWETLFRSDGSRPQAAAGDESPSAEESPSSAGATTDEKTSWDDIATRAVRRGYEVIEEQINEGRRIAEKFRGFSDDVRKGSDDTTRLIERSLRFYTDVGSLWFELMESLLRNQALRPEPRSGNGANGENHHAANGNGNGASGANDNVDIEVISSCPTSVSLDLRSPNGAALTVPPLRAADDGKPPLTDIGFHTREGRSVLRIRIPNGQPPDTYSGVVVDAGTHQPKGTLCVSVREEAAST